MPIKIPNDLPAAAILEKEHIFIMDSDRAYSQDIRPLRLLILNLMPVKQVTELPDGVLWHLCRGAPQEIRWLYHYRCAGGADAF